MSTLHEMWEAQQRERVFAEGKREGKRKTLIETLVKQLTLKFGEPSDQDVEQIERADEAMLEMFLQRVLTADSMAAVLGPE